jgi:hypothetical protein
MAMIGIDPRSLVPLGRVDGNPADSIPNAQARFRAVAADWIEDRYEADRFVWEEHWHYAPYALLAQAFTREELIRLWHSSHVASKLDDYFQEHEELVWKVQHSLWRYGFTRSFDRFVACHNGLGRVVVDLPDFDVRLTHTRFINTAAWAAHGRANGSLIYLDASFGVLLYYKGVHAMTIGFALAAEGILVAQVQLRQKRGNRFLYKLPMPYLDFALDLLRRAFPDETLALVTGSSTTAAIRRAYGKKEDCLTPETAQRIERFYDQALRGYVRTGERVSGSSDDGRVFVPLRDRPARTNTYRYLRRAAAALWPAHP